MKNRFLLSMFVTTSIFLSSCAAGSSSSEYNVYFFTANANATSVSPLINYEPGMLLEEPETPIRSGFVFSGWYIDISLTDSWDFDTDVMPEESIVLYAKWDFQIGNITYELNGGLISTENFPSSYTPGIAVLLPFATKTGHIFRGWFSYPQDYQQFPNSFGTKPGDVGIVRIPTTSYGDLIFYAHFHPIVVTVTFIHNHPLGTNVAVNPPQTRISFGSIISIGVNFPENYEITLNYLFVGWNTRRDGTGVWFSGGSTLTRQNSFDLYGQWQPVA